MLGQALVELVPAAHIVFRLLEELLGPVRELAGQTGIAHLTLEVCPELVVIGLLGIKLERVLAFRFPAWVVAVEVPVAAFHSPLALFHALAHIDTVVDTRSVGDDQGRTVVALRLDHGLEQLIAVGAHGHRGHVHIAVGHGHQAQILLAGGLAAGGELGHGPGGRGLGGLTAGVGVDLGVQNQHVHIFAGGQNMVQAAEADVVGPAVAADDPDGLLHQNIAVSFDSFQHFFQIAGGCCDGRGEELPDPGRRLLGDLGIVDVVHPKPEGFLQLSRDVLLQQPFHQLSQLASAGAQGQVHAVAELRIVFEEGVGPARSMPVLVKGVRAGGGAAAVDGGAARGVGDDHPVAEELGGQLDVGGLAAAGTGSGELEERLPELAALHVVGRDMGTAVRQAHGEGPVLMLHFGVFGQRLHDQGLFLGRADLGAVAAARAVQRRDLDAVVQSLEILAHGLEGDKGLRCLFQIFICGQERPDHRMGADEGALVALDAVFRNPLGHVDGNTPLFVGGGAGGHDAVGRKGADRQLVALEGLDGPDHLFHKLGYGFRGRRCFVLGLCPAGGVVDLDQMLNSLVHGRVVHLHDLFALVAVGVVDSFLDVPDGIFGRDYVGNLEERGLQDGVDPAA